MKQWNYCEVQDADQDKDGENVPKLEFFEFF